jgi:hypothetical protein
MKPRNGKIARLPQPIREQLNQRLLDKEPYARLLQWLNALPEVHAVMAGLFGGRPINQQNLSEWKLGGFQEWFVLSTAASGPADGLTKTQREQIHQIIHNAVHGYLSSFLYQYLLRLLTHPPGDGRQASDKSNDRPGKGKLSIKWITPENSGGQPLCQRCNQ